MTKSEANGVVTYTYDETPVFEAIDELLKFLEENSTKSIGEVFYAIYGADLAAKDASITDFDKFVDYIAAKFPGTYTVKNAVDAYITLADEKGLPSITEIYAILDTALAGMLDGASVKDMVDEMGEMTLDAFVGQMTDGATMADLYGMVKQYAAGITFGELGYRGMTVNQIVAMGKGMLPMVGLTFDLTLKYNADGDLILFELTQDLSMTMDPEADPTKMNSLSVKFVRDDAITVDIPAAITVLMNNISTKLDANGNLIIEGLAAGVDYDFSASGYGSLNLKDAVVRDAARSEEAGYDVYVLKEEYWNKTNSLGSYYYVNGKYYRDTFGYAYTYTPSEYIEFASIKDYILGVLDKMVNPDDDKYDSNDGGMPQKPGYDQEGFGSNTIVNTETPVYTFSLFGTTIGKCYQDGETWRIALNGMYGELKEGVDKPGYYFLETMTLDEFIAKLKITSTFEANTYTVNNMLEAKPSYTFVNVDGRYYPLSKANISYADGKTFQMNCVVIGGNIRLFNGYKDYNNTPLFNNDAEAVTLPEHDASYSYTSTVATFDAAGNLAFTKIKSVVLEKLVPSYFIKVDGNIYKDISRTGIVLSVDTRRFDTLTLPGGKTLYVAGESNSTSYFYENGYTAVYGYVKADSGVYVQTIALTKDGSVAEVMYRNAEEADSIYLEYFDLSTYVTKNNGVYTVSAEAIAKLKALCSEPETNFAINVKGTTSYGANDVNYTYTVYSFMNMPEITDMMGGVSSSEDIWGRLFGGGSTGESPYDVIVNDDGTVTLIFNSNYVINNVRFPANATLPSDDLIVKNQQLSAETGLDIYTFNGSYTTYSGDTYVYRNGKYYEYDTKSNYSFLLSNKADFVNSWRISDSRWRFNMVGEGELKDGAPVYETDIEFTFRHPSYGPSGITVYTFFLNGVMYAAVEAEVTGESLLTFERYMPINDYMKSLVFELELSDARAYYESRYVDGKLEKVYRNYFNVYETTENGQKMADPKYNIGCNYVIRNGTKMFIKDYSWINSVIKIGSEKTPNTQEKHRREEYLQTFSTGTTTTTVTLVSFIYENTYTYTANFVKLAGRLYRYDWYEYYLKDYSYYLEARIPEYEFKNQALDKVWYYVVKDSEKGIETYYSEFVPSDFGFTPKNEIDPSVIEGRFERETLLGYTAEGLPIYELLYFIETSGDADWDVKTVTVDGKSFKFHHKNGMGYLEVNEKHETYYVKARLVEMADGTEQIFCFIASGKITGSEANDYVSDYFDGYLTVEGNKLTITEEFLEVVNGNNKNEFFIEIYVGGLEDPDSYYNSYRIDGYRIETFFMMDKK